MCISLGYSSLHDPHENLAELWYGDGRSLQDVAQAAVNSWKDSEGHWRLAVG
jgi:hypothetical protein